MGFEPMNNGFANRRLRPLGYAAGISIFYASAAKAETQKTIYSIATLIARKLRANFTISEQIKKLLWKDILNRLLICMPAKGLSLN